MSSAKNPSPSPSEPELLDLLSRWQELSERERVAITESHWETLSALQTQKQELQARIDRLLPTDSREGTPTASFPAAVTELVSRLRCLEEDNRSQLEGKLSSLRSGMTQMNTSVRRLRQVHQAYGHTTEGAWHSYS